MQTPPICVSVSPVSLVEQPSHTQLEVAVFFGGGLSIMALCQTSPRAPLDGVSRFGLLVKTLTMEGDHPLLVE